VRAGVSRDFVAKVEQGRVSPGLLLLYHLADGLGVPLGEMFGDGLPTSWQRRLPPGGSANP